MKRPVLYHTCCTCGSTHAAQELTKDGETKHYCDHCYIPVFRAARAEYDLKLAAWHQQNIAKGQAYWDTRGIKVGDKLEARAVDMLTGGLLGSVTYTGTAKISKRIGAYVHCPRYPGQLDANYWQPAKKD